MTDFTPTTDIVRRAYITGSRQAFIASAGEHDEEFSRWLADERLAQVRFWTKVQRSDDESCWMWTGSTNPNGYGLWALSGRSRGAHIFSYEWLVGSVPPGLELDHKCRVRNCVNPRHLEAVTHRENVLRGQSMVARNAAKRFCPRGHPLTEGNLVPSSAKRRARQCLTCSRETAREYRARKKEMDQ